MLGVPGGFHAKPECACHFGAAVAAAGLDAMGVEERAWKVTAVFRGMPRPCTHGNLGHGRICQDRLA